MEISSCFLAMAIMATPSPHAYSSRHLLPIAAGAGRASAGLTCNKVMPRDPCGSVSSYITGGWLLLTPLEKWWSSSLGMMTFPKKRWKVIKCHGSKPPTRYISVPQVATSMHLWLDSDQNLKLTRKTPSTTLTQLSVTHVVDGPLCKYLLVIMARL